MPKRDRLWKFSFKRQMSQGLSLFADAMLQEIEYAQNNALTSTTL